MKSGSREARGYSSKAEITFHSCRKSGHAGDSSFRSAGSPRNDESSVIRIIPTSCAIAAVALIRPLFVRATSLLLA